MPQVQTVMQSDGFYGRTSPRDHSSVTCSPPPIPQNNPCAQPPSVNCHGNSIISSQSRVEENSGRAQITENWKKLILIKALPPGKSGPPELG